MRRLCSPWLVVRLLRPVTESCARVVCVGACSAAGPAAASLTSISLRGCSVGQGGLAALLSDMRGLSPSLRHIEADAALWTALEARSPTADGTPSRPASSRSAHERGLAVADERGLARALAAWELSVHDHVTGACWLTRRARSQRLGSSS